MIVFVGGAAFDVTPLNGTQWAICLILGLLSIPIGMLIRCIPDALAAKCVPAWLKRRSKKGPELMISDEEEQFRYPKPLNDVKEELSFLKKVKGGRLNNLKFAVQQARDSVMPRSRSGSRSRDNSIPGTPNNGEVGDDTLGSGPPPSPDSRRRSRSNRSRSNSALGATAVMAGIIAGSVAGWSPVERREGDTDATRWPRNGNARSELESRKDVEIHPDTKADDPVIAADPYAGNLPPSQVEGLRPESSHDKKSSS